MIKVKEFFDGDERPEIDDQINDFLSNNDVHLIDIKYSSATTIDDDILSLALLIYKE